LHLRAGFRPVSQSGALGLQNKVGGLGVDAHVWPDLQNTLEVEDDALGALGLQNKVGGLGEDTLEPPDLQNTLEVGDDALDALGALGLQNKVGGLGEDALEIFTCRTILRSGMMPIPDLHL
jgi:hypothetical protein